MARVHSLPRYISPASIDIGDTVRVTMEADDITVTRTGQIAKREYEGGMRVLYTKSGQELFRYHPAHKDLKVTLLEKAVANTQAMLDIFANNGVDLSHGN